MNDSENNHGFYNDNVFDFNKIKSHCDNFIVIHSRDDEWVSFSAGEENSKGLNAKFKVFEDKGHFGKSVKEVPEILEEITGNEKWPIFTTRIDTIFGVTFMVVSAQHSQLMKLVTNKQKGEIEKFVKKLSSVSEEDIDKLEKEGVFTGSYAKNPINGEEIPVYVGNFILADYGSGMVMAVPAHDKRDYEFAEKYKLPIRQVIIDSKFKDIDLPTRTFQPTKRPYFKIY